MSSPETAKWEEKLLRATIENMKTQVDVAIMAASSLGMKNLQKELENLKHYMHSIRSLFFV